MVQDDSLISPEELSSKILAADVVSFDIFDTLLVRTLAEPTDVFDVAVDRLRERGIHITGPLALQRREAEATTIRRVGGFRYRLSEVHDDLKALSGLDDRTLSEFYQAELDVEWRVLRPRESIVAAYRDAVAAGKKIVIVSDMYLPFEFIEAVLAKNGLGTYDMLVVSGAHRMSKADGLAFAYITEKFPGQRIVHIGDNPRGDFAMPRAYGIDAVLIPRQSELGTSSTRRRMINRDRLDHRPPWEMIQHSRATAMIDRDREERDRSEAERLGYELGPIVLGFVQWLHEAALRDGVEHLYFLARDGAFMREAYNAAFQDSALPSTYTFASRRVINVAAIQGQLSAADLSFLRSSTSQQQTIGDAIARFGIDLDDPRVVEVRELTRVDLERRLDSQVAHDQLGAFVALLEPLFLEIARRERSEYLRYLDAIGMTAGGNYGVVDVGWHGSMQASLQNLVAHDLTGFYFGLHESALGKPGLSHFVSTPDITTAYGLSMEEYVTIAEVLWSNPSEHTIVGVRETADGHRAVESRFTYEGEDKDRATVSAIQRGALEFVRAWISAEAEWPTHHRLAEKVATAPLISMLVDPSPRAARILGPLRHVDGFGDERLWIRTIASPSRSRLTYALQPHKLRQDHGESLWPRAFRATAQRLGLLK